MALKPPSAPPRPMGVLQCLAAGYLFFSLVVFYNPTPALAATPLLVMLEAAPKTLDPLFATDATGVRISQQLLFETLLTLDDKLQVAPGVAISWQRLTPTRYRFRLRPGVRFHDGSPLDAEDVVYSLQTLMSQKVGSPYGAVLREKIAGVNRTAPLEVEVRLKGPYASILGDLAFPVRSRQTGPDRPLLGSGPYRLVERSINEMVLERNPYYHGPKSEVERVVFKVVRDENTRLLKFRKGSVDLAVNILPPDKLALFSRTPLSRRYTLLEAPGLSFQYLGFNLRDPILRQREVRLAIAHAINVAVLIRHRQKGHSTPATGLFPKGNPHTPADLAPYPHDPALARQLLDRAGFPEKEGVRFHLTYKTSTERAAVIQARVIQSDLRKVGIAVEVRSFEWGTFYEDIGKGNFQLFSLRWIGVSDPDFYYELFHTTRVPPLGRNRGYYASPALDRLLEQGRLELDAARRRGIYLKVAQMVYEDLPYLPLWHNNNVAVVAKNITGFRLHPTGGFQYLPAVRKTAP